MSASPFFAPRFRSQANPLRTLLPVGDVIRGTAQQWRRKFEWQFKRCDESKVNKRAPAAARPSQKSNAFGHKLHASRTPLRKR
jgi:hypothetical protein